MFSALPTSRSHPHSWVHGHIALISDSVITSPFFTRILLPLFHKNPCDYTGPLWINRDKLLCPKVLNLITLVKLLCHLKYLQVWECGELGHGHLCRTIFLPVTTIPSAALMQYFHVSEEGSSLKRLLGRHLEANPLFTLINYFFLSENKSGSYFLSSSSGKWIREVRQFYKVYSQLMANSSYPRIWLFYPS